MIQGAGVVVFRKNGVRDECIIVRQSRKNYGFPKGGREEGETILQTAIRELREETGLIAGQHVSVFKRDIIQEKNDRRRITVGYYVGAVREDVCKEFEFTFDPFEIDEVKWMSLPEAFDVLLPRRQSVLEEAHRYWLSSAPKETVEAEKEEQKHEDRRLWLSKTLSWVLRYKLRDSFLDLHASPEGFVSIHELLTKVPILVAKNVTAEEIQTVATAGDYPRFEIKDKMVRAIPTSAVPTGPKWQRLTDLRKLPLCVHGVTQRTWQLMQQGLGLERGSKKYLYFSTEESRCKGAVKIHVNMRDAISFARIEFQRCTDNPSMLRSRGDLFGRIPWAFLCQLHDLNKKETVKDPSMSAGTGYGSTLSTTTAIKSPAFTGTVSV